MGFPVSTTSIKSSLRALNLVLQVAGVDRVDVPAIFQNKVHTQQEIPAGRKCALPGKQLNLGVLSLDRLGHGGSGGQQDQHNRRVQSKNPKPWRATAAGTVFGSAGVRSHPSPLKK